MAAEAEARDRPTIVFVVTSHFAHALAISYPIRFEQTTALSHYVANPPLRIEELESLEAVVRAAKSLAEVWYGTYKRLLEKPSATLVPDGIMGWNISPYQQLEEFYQVTSSVLGGKYPRVNDSFVTAIARLLMEREVAKRMRKL